MTVDFEAILTEALDQTSRAVDKRLERLIPQTDESEKRLIEAIRYAVFAGGKRLRPFLVVACGDLFNVPKQQSLRAGAAVECIHAYSLIHDDLPCMDDDDMRRGKPTLHKKYDEATAVLAGDGLQALAFEILSDEKTHPNPAVRADLVRTLSRASGIHGMVGGQMIDLDSEDKDLGMGEVTRLQQMKTGALITASAEMGAILGRATEHQRQLLLGYAHDVGLAFQIADDLLDHEGDPDEVGKATGKDAKRGKATFVSLMGPDRARQQARLLADQAADHMKEFDKDKAALLMALAYYIVERTN